MFELLIKFLYKLFQQIDPRSDQKVTEIDPNLRHYVKSLYRRRGKGIFLKFMATTLFLKKNKNKKEQKIKKKEFS
jgi:hypothetical protein